MFVCRNADARSLPAPRRPAGETLQTQEGSDSVLRLAALRPGEALRDPAVSVHAGEGGAGHGAQPVRDAGAPAGPAGAPAGPASAASRASFAVFREQIQAKIVFFLSEICGKL